MIYNQQIYIILLCEQLHIFHFKQCNWIIWLTIHAYLYRWFNISFQKTAIFDGSNRINDFNKISDAIENRCINIDIARPMTTSRRTQCVITEPDFRSYVERTNVSHMPSSATDSCMYIANILENFVSLISEANCFDKIHMASRFVVTKEKLLIILSQKDLMTSCILCMIVENILTICYWVYLPEIMTRISNHMPHFRATICNFCTI